MTHELGHIAAGLCCGGSLQSYSLSPITLPFSIFNPDPFPLVTLWCGPLLGVLAPVLFAAIIRKQACWFIAHFCVLANGMYLAVAWASGDRYLDTPKLFEHGAWPISVLSFCIFTIAVGYVGFRHQCQLQLAARNRTQSLSK